MSKVTLEDVADCIEAEMASWTLDMAASGSGRRIRQEAALVRAAQAVIEAADELLKMEQELACCYLCENHDNGCVVAVLGEKVAAFHAIEKGE